MEQKENCSKCAGTGKLACQECEGGGMVMGCFCEHCTDGVNACACSPPVNRKRLRKKAKARAKKRAAQAHR